MVIIGERFQLDNLDPPQTFFYFPPDFISLLRQLNLIEEVSFNYPLIFKDNDN